MRTLLQSGVLVEVEAQQTNYRIRITDPEGPDAINWHLAPDVAEALMLGLMEEHAR